MKKKKELKISRRTVMKGALAAGAMMSAGSIPSKLFAGEYNIPDPLKPLPTTGGNMRWIDSGDMKGVFWKKLFPEYAASRGITIEYDGLPWKEINKIVPIAIRNGTVHDVFQLPLGMDPGVAVAEGWVQPWDDYIENIDEWLAGFPSGVYLPGGNQFNGKTYGTCLTANKRTGTCLLYSEKYMSEAGYDPQAGRMTYSEIRDAAKKITKNGNGQYYGWIIGGNQVNRWEDVVHTFGQVGGAHSGRGGFTNRHINFQNGKFQIASDQYMEAVELLLQLKSDGSAFPGVMSMNAPQARALMPQGAAGMIFQGPWCIGVWGRDAPNWKYGIASEPVPDGKEAQPLYIAEGGSNTFWLSANSTMGPFAGDLIRFMGTEQGQIYWAQTVGAADPAVNPDAVAKAGLTGPSAQALSMFAENILVGPNPIVRNKDVGIVAAKSRVPDPSLALVIQGLYTGQLKGVEAQLKDCNQRYEDALDKAVEEARADGANVTRDDWVFPNWDVYSNYGAEKYQEL